MKVSVGAAHLDAALLKVLEIAPGEKGDRDAGLGQLGPVIHPECAGAHHRGGGTPGQGLIWSDGHPGRVTVAAWNLQGIAEGRE